MKRKVVVICCMLVILVIVVQQVSAQGFFNQKKAQKKRLLEQIALLQVYIDLLKKGYRIVEDGLQLIDDIKHGDFNIHNAYFTSLKHINPAIRSYSRVKSITEMYYQIAQLYDQSTKLVQDPAFTSSDRDAVERVFVGLLTGANQNLEELKTLTTAGNFSLTDDERLIKIESLAADMKDKYGFAKGFSNSIGILRIQKKKEVRDVITGEHMLNVK